MSDVKEKNAAAVELGKLGGRAASKKLGREHYQRIGSLGGKKVVETHSREHFIAIGKRGADRVREIMAAGRAAMAAHEADGEG